MNRCVDLRKRLAEARMNKLIESFKGTYERNVFKTCANAVQPFGVKNSTITATTHAAIKGMKVELKAIEGTANQIELYLNALTRVGSVADIGRFNRVIVDALFQTNIKLERVDEVLKILGKSADWANEFRTAE